YEDVIRRETDVIRDQLARNHVALMDGSATFFDPHTVDVTRHDGSTRQVTADNIVIAAGTRPLRPPTVQFDGRTVFDSDELLEMDRIPGSLVVVGAGVIGIEYASIFAALGTKVSVVDKRRRILDFCDDEIMEGLQHHLRDLGVTFRLGEEVTAVEEGRIAALDAFGQEVRTIRELFPLGIYTIPEISFVGKTEQALTEAGIPYEVGLSRYKELARGAILGEAYGMLKILVSPEDRRILGVHVLGTGATEVVHIGQAVMGNDGTLDYLLDTVFNYPTLAESYKVAALDAQNRINATSRFTS